MDAFELVNSIFIAFWGVRLWASTFTLLLELTVWLTRCSLLFVSCPRPFFFPATLNGKDFDFDLLLLDSKIQNQCTFDDGVATPQEADLERSSSWAACLIS